MLFENEGRFIEWYRSNARMTAFRKEAVLEEVYAQYAATGKRTYEMKAHDSKSGHPELYSFDAKEIHDQEYDTWQTIIIF